MISGEVDIERVVVNYANGTVHYEDRALTLKTGERMARMDDRDETREIEFIDVYIKAGTVSQAIAVVEIGGIKRPPAPPSRSFSISSAPAPKSKSKTSAKASVSDGLSIGRGGDSGLRFADDGWFTWRGRECCAAGDAAVSAAE